ncbi:MAG: hypothetical protein HN996_05310 [Opitutae bacterium]|jgi:hypothetical protein|nr:hypothetical protein [Opitutae bacterium]
MRMVKPVCIEYSLQELEAGTIESMGFDRNSFIEDEGNIKAYLARAEDFPPVRLIHRLRPLIIDEAVAPKDMIISIVDSDNGRHFHYNIEQFLEDTLGKHVPHPPIKEEVAHWIRSL